MCFVKISGRKVCSFFLMTKFRRDFFYILHDYVAFSQFFGVFRSREVGSLRPLSALVWGEKGVLLLLPVSVRTKPSVFGICEVGLKAGTDVSIVVVEPGELFCGH